MGMIDFKIWQDCRRRTAKGYPIKFVIVNGKDRFLISSGVYSDLPLDNGRISMRDPSGRAKNSLLNTQASMLQDAIWQLGKRTVQTSTLKALLDAALSGKSGSQTFLDCVEEYISRLSKEGTIITYRTMKSKVEQFDRKVFPDDITVAWMEDFELWMKKQGYSTNYYGQIERSIRAVVRHCIKRGYSSTDAFKIFKCKKEDTRKRNISPEQFRTLRDFECEEHQKKYRDMFCLMVYLRGISPVDLFMMKRPEKVAVGEYISYRREKTGKYVPPVRLEPEAVEIIKRYAGRKYLVNVMETHKNYKDFLHRMGNGLKLIGPMKHVGKKGKKEHHPLFPQLSAYWARHTWITAAVRGGLQRSVVAMAVGQVPKMTLDIYAEYDSEMFDEASRRVLDYLNEKNKK